MIKNSCRWTPTFPCSSASPSTSQLIFLFAFQDPNAYQRSQKQTSFHKYCSNWQRSDCSLSLAVSTSISMCSLSPRFGYLQFSILNWLLRISKNYNQRIYNFLTAWITTGPRDLFLKFPYYHFYKTLMQLFFLVLSSCKNTWYSFNNSSIYYLTTIYHQ